MKSYIRAAFEQIEALGFVERTSDYDRARGVRFYIHPHHPDEQPIKLYQNATEPACSAAVSRALEIEGLAKVAPSSLLNRKERAKQARERRRAEEIRRTTAELHRARAAYRNELERARHLPAEVLKMRALTPAERSKLIAEERNHHFYAGLMRPGHTR